MDIVDWLKGQAAVHAAAGDKEAATNFDIAVSEIESLRESSSIEKLYKEKSSGIMREMMTFLTPVEIEMAYQMAYNNSLKQKKRF